MKTIAKVLIGTAILIGGIAIVKKMSLPSASNVKTDADGNIFESMADGTILVNGQPRGSGTLRILNGEAIAQNSSGTYAFVNGQWMPI